jgi:hypothetical protein
MTCQTPHHEAGILFRRRLTLRSKVKRSGRSQNRMHAQKAPMEYLLLGKPG